MAEEARPARADAPSASRPTSPNRTGIRLRAGFNQRMADALTQRVGGGVGPGYCRWLLS